MGGPGGPSIAGERDATWRDRRAPRPSRRWTGAIDLDACEEAMSVALLGARYGDVVVALRLDPDDAGVGFDGLEEVVRSNVRDGDTIAAHPAQLVVVLLPDARTRGARRAVVRIRGDLEAMEGPGRLTVAYAAVGRSESGLDAARRAMRVVLGGRDSPANE